VLNFAGIAALGEEANTQRAWSASGSPQRLKAAYDWGVACILGFSHVS